MHGEYFANHFGKRIPEGSPPYARGILDITTRAASPTRITPVCTGNTFTDFSLKYAN